MNGLGELQVSVQISKKIQLYLRYEKIWTEIRNSIKNKKNVFLVGMRKEGEYLKSIEIIGIKPWSGEKIKSLELIIEEIVKKYISSEEAIKNYGDKI